MININENELRYIIENKLTRYFGVNIEEASKEQIYKSAALAIKDILSAKRTAFNAQVKAQSAKKVYYLCMEFLVGCQLKNNLMNLGLYNTFENIDIFLFYTFFS